MRNVISWCVLAGVVALGLVATPMAHSAAGDAGQADASTDARRLGTLAPEVIQRVVRASFGRFKTCYADALRQKPDLGGRVVTAFTIEADGRVSNARDSGGSDLPDLAVRMCVFRKFAELEFPAPEGGVVSVVYPLVFTPRD